MITQTARFFLPVVLIPLLATSTALAQTTTSKIKPEYLDFSQFATIVSAEEVGLGKQFKWAGMKFVNAPAEKRVISLYKYAKEDIADYKCSDKRLQNHYALLVGQLIPKASVNSARADDPKEQSKLKALKGIANAKQWLTNADLMNSKLNVATLQKLGIRAEPVWYELTFSNSCELKKMLVDFDYKSVDWHVVHDPKLRSIIQSKAVPLMLHKTFTPSVIAAVSLFEKSSGKKQYFAECQSKTDREAVETSLCKKVQ